MKKYFQAPWTIKDVGTILAITGILLAVAFFLTNFLDIKLHMIESKYKSLYLLGFLILQWLIIIIPWLSLSLKKYKLSFKSLGIIKTGVWETIKLVFSGYFLFLGITLIISLIVIYTGIQIPGYQIQQKLLPLFGDSTLNIALTGIAVVIIAPVLEEIFFRGFLLRSLSDKWGIAWGSILSAALFAIIHMQFESIIPIFILGLIINSLVIRSKSILPSIFFHVFNNAIAFSVEILLLKDIIKIEEII